jgi:predicted RNA-binding protein with PUA-like domain
MAGRWLVKTEPGSFSFAALQREGKTIWDGVRNPVAAKHLRGMSPGDLVFVYHTGSERAVVGVARVTKAPHPEPGDPKWVAVGLEPVRALDAPVPLSAIREESSWKGLGLVRTPRLSVMPVSEEAWQSVERLSKSPAATGK